MKVFMGLTEVSGFFHRLKSGCESEGIYVEHLSLQGHRFAYSSEENDSFIVKLAKKSVQRRIAAAKKSKFLSLLFIPYVAFVRLIVFVWAVMKFDCFILGAGSSFFNFLELPILKLLKKRVIYTLHGTDARPPYMDGFFIPEQYGIKSFDESRFNQHDEYMAYAHMQVTKLRRKRIRFIEKYVDVIVCAPNYAHFLSEPFVNMYDTGLPTELSEDIRLTTSNNKIVRVLHAPSYLKGKGTDQIRKIIEEIKSLGYEIDYVEVSGKPNAEVYKEIGRSDFVIDQLYSDTPMAAFAAEAASLGKPAIVGGYYSELLAKEVKASSIPPSIFCLPEDLKSNVIFLLEHPSERTKLGLEARDFIVNHWGEQKVASRFIKLMRSDLSDMRLDPSCLKYMKGVGLSDIQVEENIRNLIKYHGLDSLGLDNKPGLVEFCKKNGWAGV